MKKLLLLFLGIGLLTLTRAQQTLQSVLAPAGQTEVVSEISIDWTLGELAVQSLETSMGLLTEGFHQPVLNTARDLVTPGELPGDQILISMYPNPTYNSLFLLIESEVERRVKCTLKTMYGHLLHHAPYTVPGEIELNLRPYSAGLYVLIVQNEKGEILKSMKIIKID